MKSWIGLALVAGASVVAGVLAVSYSRADLSPTTKPARTSPVVVELFTSEGCSSCPAADGLLRELDRRGKVEGRDVLALGFHVDYWNRLGWPDAFSSPQYTARQRTYAQQFNTGSVYTPQAIVNGRREFVGSDADAMNTALREAADLLPVEVVATLSENRLKLDIKPAGEGKLLLVVTESGLSTEVRRGENAGREIQHAPTVRVLKDLGEAGTTPTTATIDLDPGWNREHLRVIAMVQNTRTGEIRSAGWTALSK